MSIAMKINGPAQLPLDLPHRAARGREDFLVAPCNADAVAWIDRYPDWTAPALTVYGPSGCGKTHLLEVWRERTGAPALDPETLTASGLDAEVGDAAAVAVDDAARVAEPDALFHLYNMMRERGGHLMLTAESAPARWDFGTADLRSRVTAAPSVEIGAPDDALLGAVMVKLFHDRQLDVGADVLGFLLPRMERTFAAASGVVHAVDAAALAERRRITVPLVRRVLDRLQGE